MVEWTELARIAERVTSDAVFECRCESIKGLSVRGNAAGCTDGQDNQECKCKWVVTSAAVGMGEIVVERVGVGAWDSETEKCGKTRAQQTIPLRET